MDSPVSSYHSSSQSSSGSSTPMGYPQVDHTPSTSFCKTVIAPISTGEMKSFGVSFIISTILSLNPIAGVIGGAISFLASRIDAIVSPIMRQHLEKTADDIFGAASPFVKFALKLIVVLGTVNLLAFAIAPLIGLAIEVDLIFTIILSVAINIPRLLNKQVNILGDAPEGRPYFVLFA